MLYSRYVDQFSQKEVADQLGISLRTYQREQQLALEFLAGTLAEKYPAAKFDSPASPVELEAEDQDAEGADYAEEFSWMFTPSSERSSSLDAIVASACQLVRPLADRYRVNLDIDLAGALPKVAIHSEALLQIVLNVLNVAVHQSMGGDIRIDARLLNWEANLTVEGKVSFSRIMALSDADRASMDVVRKLVELGGGSIRVAADENKFSAAIHLPTLESLPVLVIDDSADNLKLLQRYLAGTHYQMKQSQPARTRPLALIEQTHPQIVILDLMMPGVDGLEILTHLHSTPATCHIPVVVLHHPSARRAGALAWRKRLFA